MAQNPACTPLNQKKPIPWLPSSKTPLFHYVSKYPLCPVIKIHPPGVPTLPQRDRQSLQGQDTGSISSPAQWVKDLALPQQQGRMQLWLRPGPWPENSICHGGSQKRKTKKPPNLENCIQSKQKTKQINKTLLVYNSLKNTIQVPYCGQNSAARTSGHNSFMDPEIHRVDCNQHMVKMKQNRKYLQASPVVSRRTIS